LFADQSESMLLLTGPNYSGKSVYMKQVRISSHTMHNYRLNSVRLP
jgi:DNA mismatch repair ATPase MutS